MNLSRLLIDSVNDDNMAQLKVKYIKDLTETLNRIPDSKYLKYLYENAEDADVSSTICVQIPSYKDVNVINTVNSLLVNAANPDRLRIKIFLQDDDEDLLKKLQETSNVEVRHIPSDKSRGSCYARYQCNLMMEDDTDFTMHTDSHMRCAKFWDVALILSWKSCDDEKAIVSQRPYDFSKFYDEPIDSDMFIKKVLYYHMKLVYYQYSKTYCNNILPKPLCVYPPSEITSRQSACISAGLVFGKAEIDRLVPFDPEMYFVADENSMAVRYWTHGFNIYFPEYYFIYHLYHRNETIERHTHSTVDVGYDKASDQDKRIFEQDRLKSLFNLPREHDIDLGNFGLGNKRLLNEYQQFCGVDFAHKIIKGRSLNGKCEIPSDTASDDRIVWQEWKHKDMHIGIYYIATGPYKDLFPDFLKSLCHFYPDCRKTVVVISDGLTEWEDHSDHNLSVCMGTIINHYPSPVVSLYKMYLIKENYDPNFTHMCCFDANALVCPNFKDSVLDLNKLNVTAHNFGPLYDPFTHVSINPKSVAYLNNYTYDYVQSCFFFGPSWLVTDMCDSVTDMVKNDTSRCLFAQWHDESYMNKWCHTFKLKGYINRKQFCLFETLPMNDEHSFISMRDKRRFFDTIK